MINDMILKKETLKMMLSIILVSRKICYFKIINQIQQKIQIDLQFRKMDDDMRKSLLNKKSAPFDKLYEQCMIKIQRIKQKNDFMQKQIGTDVQEAIRSEVNKQKQFIQKQIKELKAVMGDMQKRFKDPQSRNKLKNIKTDAQRQIQRNKIIMKDLINKSFLMKSRGSTHSEDDVNQYIQGGNVNFNHLDHNRNHENNNDDKQNQYNKQSLLTDNQIDIDFQIQRKILQQKKQLLDQVEQTTVRVNLIMNDMALQVNEQGQNLDVISEELMKTNQNMVAVNQNMEQASKYQKKSKKKYIVFTLLLILLIVGVVGIVFILK